MKSYFKLPEKTGLLCVGLVNIFLLCTVAFKQKYVIN